LYSGVHHLLEPHHVGRGAGGFHVGVVQGDVEIGQLQQRDLGPGLTPQFGGDAGQAAVERLLAGAAREDQEFHAAIEAQGRGRNPAPFHVKQR
jgi:hypothetical protein